MRGARSRKKNQQPDTAATPSRRGFKFEWALLLYPACIVGALVVLYVVNHSIQTGTLPAPSNRGSVKQPDAGPAHAGQPASGSATPQNDPAARAVPAPQPQDIPADGGTETVQGPQQDGREGNLDSTVSTAARAQDAAGFEHLEGPARIVAILRMAIQAEDHTRIKECLNELVALGDAAVVSLNDLVNTEGEAGLWAAEALARIGTPMATSALLDTLGQTKEGTFKEELCRRVSNITNHDSWPLLLDTMTQTADPTVARAAGASLSRMADTPVIDEIIARYDAATEAEAERLARLIGSIESPNASDALLALAGDVTSPPVDSLQRAAIDALANVGDAQAVSHLIQRLEAATPGAGSSVYNAITRIKNPDAHSQLLYAAAGNKEVSAGYGRTAAIEALRNYPTEETCALLERIIAQEANEKVVTAASRTLDDIRRAPHVVTANAESLQKSEEMLPLKPLLK